MRMLRAVLTALVIAALVGLPALVLPAGSPWGHGLASAAPASGALADNHNDNGDGNDHRHHNENWNENNNANQNDNDDNQNDNDDNWNENDNDDSHNGNANDNDDDDDDDDGNWNDNRHERHGPPPPPPPPPGMVSQCYGAGETGSLTLTLPGGSVALTVVPGSTFGRESRITLEKSDPFSAPGAPGGHHNGIVFELRAQDGCNGGALGELPADANLGLTYAGPTMPGLTFAIWDGSRWAPVPTVADPNPANPYISATIRRTGTYTIYRAP